MGSGGIESGDFQSQLPAEDKTRVICHLATMNESLTIEEGVSMCVIL